MSDSSYITADQWYRLSRKGTVRFALYCANQHKDRWKDNTDAIKAVRVINQWLKRKATKKQCRDVLYMFRHSPKRRRIHAHNLIINALHTCIDNEPTQCIRYSEYLVSDKKIMKAQNKYYNELLSLKENVLKKKAEPITMEELDELSRKDQGRFAIFFCNYLKYQWKKCHKSVEAMRLAELRIEDKVTSEECLEFADHLTYFEINDNVHDLLYAVASEHYDFSAFVGFGHGDYSERFTKAQRKYYNELRYIDDIFEKLVLEGNV